MEFVIAVVLVVVVLYITNLISYRYLKSRILNRQRWDLNICCGKTHGGGVNADVVSYGALDNFVLVDNIYHLPFTDKQFDTVLCSHTMEHVDNPDAFFAELQRVGQRVTIVLPPVWDLSAALNFLEHKWLFLTFRKEHAFLPKHIPLPLSGTIQRLIGQRMHA